MPEIKYKLFEQIKNLPDIQYQILLTSSKYVKKGGYLIYSTCTLNRYENDMVIDKFLENNHEFIKSDVSEYIPSGFENYELNQSHKLTIFPSKLGGDGFFISKLKKCGD